MDASQKGNEDKQWPAAPLRLLSASQDRPLSAEKAAGSPSMRKSPDDSQPPLAPKNMCRGKQHPTMTLDGGRSLVQSTPSCHRNDGPHGPEEKGKRRGPTDDCPP